MTDFAVAAHHGACRTIDECGASENSLASIALVEPFGATIVELDVRLTSDGIPILFHDDSWAPRLVDGPLCRGGVDQLSLADVRANCRLLFGETIPTLDEALQFVVDYTDIRTVWLDVKVAGAIPAASDAVRKFEAQAAQKQRAVHFIVGIGDNDILAAFTALPPPRVPCLLELELQQVEAAGCEVWGPRWTRGPMASDVAAAKSKGIFTAFWTIDETEFLDRFLLEAKPNAILTDREGLLFHRYQVLAPRLQGGP
jgi:glycerophosphoryl diester phosphodiesterase